MLSVWAVRQTVSPTEIWRTIKTNMWSLDFSPLLAKKNSNFIPEIYPCYFNVHFFFFNLKENQNTNMERTQTVKQHQGAGTGRKRWK